MTKLLEVLGNLADRILTREGLFGLLFVALAIFTGWLYFVVIQRIADDVDLIRWRQDRECARTRPKGVDVETYCFKDYRSGK